MSEEASRVKARFGPEIMFPVNPGRAVPFKGASESRLELLKARLLTERLESIWDAPNNSRVRRAANEAAAVAWASGFPLLFFPALFDEKVETALAQAERQDHVSRVTRELLAV